VVLALKFGAGLFNCGNITVSFVLDMIVSFDDGITTIN